MTVASRDAYPHGREETRGRIIQAALELFGRDGFDRTTVKAIAERCGISDAALYYYFRSKRHILDSLWDRPEGLKLDPPAEQGLMDEGELCRLASALIETCADHDSLLRLIVRQVLAGDRTAIALRNQTMTEWRAELLPHFESRFAKEDAVLRAESLLMLTIGLVFTAQIAHGDDFPAVARSRDFQERAARLARVAAPMTGSGRG